MTLGEFDADLALFGEYVTNAQGVEYHKKWIAANKNGDAPKWAGFRDALLAGQTPAVPAMATKYGRALVTAGRQHMSISRIVGQIQNPYPPPDPQPEGRPPLPTSWRGQQTISSGGTYEDAWETTGSAPCVIIATNQPVTLKGWLRNLSGANLIQCQFGVGLNLTVESVHAYAGSTYLTSGRFIEAESNVQNITVRNCTINNTRGIDVATSNGANILVEKNRHLNVQSHNDNPFVVGNFVQLRVMTPASAIIRWNEVVNTYNVSEPHDIISLYHIVGCQIIDNFLFHQSRPNNETPSSQGGITIDGSDAGPGVHNIYCARNQVIDGYGIVASVQSGGSNNLIENNRIIADRLLPNGQIKANGLGAPLTITTGGSNNHAHGNVVGYIDAAGTHITQSVGASFLAGAAEGGAAEAANNTYMALGDITAVAEQAEWAIWQQRLTSNGIVLGA